jgi:hypothetical protein
MAKKCVHQQENNAFTLNPAIYRVLAKNQYFATAANFSGFATPFCRRKVAKMGNQPCGRGWAVVKFPLWDIPGDLGDPAETPRGGGTSPNKNPTALKDTLQKSPYRHVAGISFLCWKIYLRSSNEQEMRRRVCMTYCQVFPYFIVDEMKKFVPLYGVGKYYECPSHNIRRPLSAINDFQGYQGFNWRQLAK